MTALLLAWLALVVAGAVLWRRARVRCVREGGAALWVSEQTRGEHHAQELARPLD